MKRHLKWFLPLLFLGLLAPFTPYLDLMVSERFYSPETGFYNNAFFHFLYHYGELFGFATGGLGLSIFFLSYVRPKWKRWRRGSFAIVLTLVIGAGLITNALFKEFWGRPRPKQIEQFGGNHVYRAFWQPNFRTRHDPQKSFPSGHVAMGFYFLSMILVGKRTRNQVLFVGGIVLTAGLGGSLMVARVVQGGHFVSDVVTSPVLMWLVALGVDQLTWGEMGERFLSLQKPRTSQEPDEASAA